MTSKLLAAAALGMSLAACSSTGLADAAGVAKTALTTDETPETALPYIAMSGSSDMFEIQSSKLHHAQGQDPRLHAFAQMMIDHHTRTTSATLAAARAAGLRPPAPKMMPLHADMLARIRPLRGAEFDREYRRQQVLNHELALRVQENYAKDGDTPALKANAAATVPIVRGHLDQIRAIEL